MPMTAALEALHDAVSTMDLPEARKAASDPQNLRWIGRNMGIRNADHLRFPAACAALRALGVQMIVGDAAAD